VVAKPKTSKLKSKTSSTNIPADALRQLWCGSHWRKVGILVITFILAFTILNYAVAQWYVHKHSKEPLVLGTTFIADYAESFGLDPKATLQAAFEDLGVKQIRLASYWKDIEPTPGHYDFSKLDWQFDMAQKYGAKVSLAVGLRQPRWPECHEPSWANISAPEAAWKPQLYNYMSAVIDRYKNRPNLQDYQLENEFFMSVFGECKNFDRSRLVEEFNLVKKLDPTHPIVISRSNNWIGLPLGQPRPDMFGISVYKRVWDAAFTHRYFEYPLPAWFYSALAGWGQIFTGRDMVIHELQAESWTPNGLDIKDLPIAEQYKSMNPTRMKARIEYGEATGMRQIDLWGMEWWYWLKVSRDKPEIWNVVKAEIKQSQLQNQKL
jgi:hypothetical protein